jgi:ferritin-like protein
MLSEKQINSINQKILSNRVFKFTGSIISGVDTPSDIDYTVKITGYKKMMSVGEYYDYALLKVTIIGVNDYLSKLLFSPEQTEDGKMIAKSFESRLYKFYSDLNLDINRFLRIFESDIRTTIDDLQFDLPKPLTESKMSRLAVRTAVKDIVNILKNGKAGEFRLPDVEDGSEYQFINLPFGFSVELFIEIDNDIEKYKMNGQIVENDVIQIIIRFNPKTLKNNFYNIIGELNEIVAHELEHLYQEYRGGRKYKTPPDDSFKYYTQPHEVKAQRAGFRRVAKLRKLPFNDVVRDWFEDHKEIHGLSDDESEKVIYVIIDGK